MVYAIQMTSTAISGPVEQEPTEAQQPVQEQQPNELPTATAVSSSDGAPSADSDPFGTGIQITTDPNAVPMLNLPPAPMPTPKPNLDTTNNSSLSDAFSDESFGSGIPDSFFSEGW